MGPKKLVPSPEKKSNRPTNNTKVAEFNFSHNNTSKRTRSEISSKGSENSFNEEISLSGSEQIMNFLGGKIDKLYIK